MAVVRRDLPYDVVEGARRRIVNAFSNGVPVYLSMSGGKDSIVLSHLVYSLVREGRIDPSLLRVIFFDEEAIYGEVERIVLDWRRRFRSIGAGFDWYCIEVRHFNCFNRLENDESFICWDSTKRDVWVRPMPSFAITDHPVLRRRLDTYQEFSRRVFRDGVEMVGTRVAESVQRLAGFAASKRRADQGLFQPIFDWKDTDVWQYIADHDLDFPETYLHLYQIGHSRREMRLSQFFSIDTAKSLVRMSEHDPGLMDRIIAREPNAYLAALYWDTEMFRSAGQDEVKAGGKAHSPGTAQDDGPDGSGVDWKARALAQMYSPEARRFGNYRDMVSRARSLLRYEKFMTEAHWRTLYGAFVAGDPKNRTMRGLYTAVRTNHAKEAMK